MKLFHVNDYLDTEIYRECDVLDFTKGFYQFIYRKDLNCRDELAVYCCIRDRRRFYETKVIATNLMYDIERLSEEEYEKSENRRKFENDEYLKRCQNEEDNIEEKLEIDMMLKILDCIRWSKQIRILWREGKDLKMIKDRRSVASEAFDLKAVRDMIKDFKIDGKMYLGLLKFSKSELLKLASELEESYNLMQYNTRHNEAKIIPYNRKEIYGLIRNSVYPKKVKKNVVINPIIQKIASMSIKNQYWKIMVKVNVKKAVKAIFAWERLAKKKVNMQKVKVIKRVKFIKSLGSTFESVIGNIQKIWRKNICEKAKDLLEKEAKARRKILRRKWKKFTEKCKSDRTEEIFCKFDRKKIWKEFVDKGRMKGTVLKDKIAKYNETASRRNEMLMSLCKTAANNIQYDISEKEKELKKRRILFENMSGMDSSVFDNESLKSLCSNQVEIYNKWWHSKFEEEAKTINQFEKDNLFYIDKRVWSEIGAEKIIIRSDGKNIGQKNYKEIKPMLKRGIRIDYPDMLKIRRFIDYSITCPIDEGRVNILYFKLMKSMNMFNRLKHLEEWLMSKEWRKGLKMKVMHIHILGSSNNIKMRKVWGLEKFAVNIPENDNYEIIGQLIPAKVNKAVSNLRWIRNKYRQNKISYDINEATNLLKIWKCSYGIQRNIDRFIIWKYAIKWEVYAEILFNGKLIIMNGFGNRKKRRKIDILYDIINSFQRMFKMKNDRIYNLFNQKNLKQLIRKAVKKKRRIKYVLYFEEETIDLYLEKVSKN